MTPRELRQRRLALGWTIEELAKKVGVSARMIADWEEGSRPVITPAALEQILKQAPPDKPEPQQPLGGH